MQQRDKKFAQVGPICRVTAGRLERDLLMERAGPQIRQQVDRDAVGPPLRQHVQFAANREPRLEALQRQIDQWPFSTFQREQEQ